MGTLDPTRKTTFQMSHAMGSELARLTLPLSTFQKKLKTKDPTKTTTNPSAPSNCLIIFYILASPEIEAQVVLGSRVVVL